jgi:hypothetical protein
MDYLSLDEIIYITKFLDLQNTFNFIKSLKCNLDYKTDKTILIKNKKLMVIENIYFSYLEKNNCTDTELKELIEFFHQDIDIEDLICFMANVYPNYPLLRDTILFDLLKLYNFSLVDWNLIKSHFRLRKNDLKIFNQVKKNSSTKILL